MSTKPTNQIYGVLFTVGGTIAPILYTLKNVRPKIVAFLCSETTAAEVEQIKAAVGEFGLRIEPRTFRVDNPDDLLECLNVSQKALAWLMKERGLAPANVRVDYTGGKKNMAAAAVLAAVPLGLQFLYVTGPSDKGGRGAVISGKEELVPNANPWEQLGVEDIRLALRLADEGQYVAAGRLIAKQRDRAEEPTAKRLCMLDDLLRGFAAWDAFDHKSALGYWKQGQLPSKLGLAAEQARDALLMTAAEAASKVLDHLQKAAAAVKCVKKAPEPDPALVDLIACADRRLERDAADLAALLYYRSLELNASRRLERIGIEDNSRVPLEEIPESLRAEWRNKPRKGETVALGMMDSYELLSARGDESGVRFVRDLKDWRRLAGRRNGSWLVHKLAHVSSKNAKEMRERVVTFLKISESDLPKWPRLSIGT